MLDHPAERAYAIAVTIVIGGWLTTATAIGAATSPRTRRVLLTDQVVEAAATYYADYRPPLDPVSQRAVEQTDDYPERMVVPLSAEVMTEEHADEPDGPDVTFWAALVVAPLEGTTVPDLMAAL